MYPECLALAIKLQAEVPGVCWCRLDLLGDSSVGISVVVTDEMAACLTDSGKPVETWREMRAKVESIARDTVYAASRVPFTERTPAVYFNFSSESEQRQLGVNAWKPMEEEVA